MIILWARLDRPTWGPKKLRAKLAGVWPTPDLPAVSTFGGVIARHGLAEPRPRRRREVPAYPLPLQRVLHPNDTWCADFKGDFLLRNGVRCYPFTLTDAHSRYLLRCKAMPATLRDEAQEHLRSAFREHGLPLVIRTDNGVPFVGTSALAGLSSLSVWLIRLGVWPERIRLAAPQDNGRHERMHRTLKREACREPKSNLTTQQRAFDEFVADYNYERPHEALEMRVPAEAYEPSPRPFPEKLPTIEYDAGVEVRRVSSGGFVSFKGRLIFLTKALAGQHIGLSRTDSGDWLVRFGPLPIATISEETGEVAELPTEPVDLPKRAA